jgi:hypothetical protein
MQAAIQISTPTDRPRGVHTTQHDLIVCLLDAGEMEVRLGRYAAATQTYYSVFQPDLRCEHEFGLRRVASMELFEEAASRLRTVAFRYAQELMERRFFLAGESPEGPVGVPRGALNLYLISNQHDAFTEHALKYAVEQRAVRNINRFLMSSVRARLLHLEKVSNCAPLLSVEQESINALSGFERKLHARLVVDCM